MRNFQRLRSEARHPSKAALFQVIISHIDHYISSLACRYSPSPVMAHAREEVADMAGISSALVLNIGTLTSEIVEAMLLAGKSATVASLWFWMSVKQAPQDIVTRNALRSWMK